MFLNNIYLTNGVQFGDHLSQQVGNVRAVCGGVWRRRKYGGVLLCRKQVLAVKLHRLVIVGGVVVIIIELHSGRGSLGAVRSVLDIFGFGLRMRLVLFLVVGFVQVLGDEYLVVLFAGHTGR